VPEEYLVEVAADPHGVHREYTEANNAVRWPLDTGGRAIVPAR
jgi:hypothetical protein